MFEKLNWRQTQSVSGKCFSAPARYGCWYTIVKAGRRFALRFTTPAMMVRNVGSYPSLANAKRAARRDFIKP